MGLHLAKQKHPYGIQPGGKANSDDQLVRKKRWPLNPVYPLKMNNFGRRPRSAISGLKGPSGAKEKRRSDGFREVLNGYESHEVISPRRVHITGATNPAGKSRTCERGASSLKSVVNNDLRMRTYTKLTCAESTCTLETEQGLPVDRAWSEDGECEDQTECIDDAVGSDIIRRTVALLSYEVEPFLLEEFWNSKRASGEEAEVRIEQSSVSKTVESVRESLAPIIRDPDSEDYRAFCDVLRERAHEHYLADYLEVLSALLKLKADDDAGTDGGEKPSQCLCHLTGGDSSIHRDRRFDLELIYVDRDTRKTKSFNGVTSLKRRRYRKSRSEADHVTKVRVGDAADRFVPMLSVRLYSQCLCEFRIRQLQRIIEAYPCVRDLSLVRTRLDDQAKVRLGRAIEQSVGLYQLDLNLSSLGDDGAMYLASALRSNRDLRSLKLSSNELTERGCSLLVKGLSCSRTLTELNLGFNDVGDGGCTALAGVLAGNRCHLRRLQLRNNNVTATGATALFRSLRKNSRLRLLDLGSNDITDEALTVLSDALIHNRTLTDLSVDNCGITRHGCHVISRPLKINTKLRSLSLSMNAIGDAGAKRLSEGVRHNRSLAEISLNMCEISNAGLWHLLEAVRHNPRMRTVKLCYNLIDVAPNFERDVRSFRKGGKTATVGAPPDVTSGVGKERIKSRGKRDVTSVASSKRDRKSFPFVSSDAMFGRDSAFFDSDDTSVDDVSGTELYTKLVELLHANSPLKIVLWGNRLDDTGHHMSVTTSSQDSIDYL